MTDFGFMRWVSKHDEEDSYRTPDFPDHMKQALLLADSARGTWAVWEYLTHDPAWRPDAPVSADLENMLRSAKRYPPALALARDDVSLFFRERGDGHDATLASLATIYEAALQRRLSRQHDMPFLFAKAVHEEPGYLCVDQWYWVLAAATKPGYVRWVSDDYFVYANPASNFALTRDDVAKLPTTLRRDRG